MLAPDERTAKVRHEGFALQPRALTARHVAQCRATCASALASPGHCVEPAPGHYDVLVPEFAAARFGFLHAGAPWMSTVRALMGDDCVICAGGVLDVDPGAAAGEAHRGGSHLLEEPLPGAAAAAPHCMTVLIPLVDVDGEANGTALWPRSHHGEGWSPPAAGPPACASSPASETSDAAVAPASCSRGTGNPTAAVSPALRAGDALLVDLRLLRLVLSNKTAARRPMAYLLLARPWFRAEVRHRPADIDVASVFARVALAAEHAPVAVGDAAHLFLGGAWARAVVAEVRPHHPASHSHLICISLHLICISPHRCVRRRKRWRGRRGGAACAWDAS